uniref:Chromo domain-containing protein n=1 Tax=Globodera rostochiensis TaxID=31243 RepID=A0A914HP16_GLORO
MKKIAQSPLPKFDDQFHKVVNAPRKVLYTMVARRMAPQQQQQPNSGQKPDDQQQQSSTLADKARKKKDQQRQNLGITSTKAKAFTVQQQQKQAVDGGGVQQQQQQQLDETVMDQVHHQQQKQAVDGGGVQQQQQQLNVDDEINVTTSTTGSLVEYSMTPSPVQNRPKRRTACAAMLQIQQQQVKPKRQRAVQQQQQSASLSVAAPPTPPTANVADIEEAMGEQLVASLALDPAEDETGQVATMTAEERKKFNNRRKRQKKLANREHDTSFKVRIVTPVPQVVQQQQQKRRKEVDEEEEEFEIKALLALFVHSDGERAYYVDWKTRSARDIMFSKDATQRQRTKAIGQLDQFVVDCMSEEAIALYKEKERKKEEKKKQQQQQQMNGVEKRK